MTAELLIAPQQQFIDANGKPYAFGKLYCYVPDTFTPKNTWQDSGENTLNTNPIILDVRGCCVVFGEGDYRFILTDADGNQVFDLVASEPFPASGIGDGIRDCLASVTQQQFLDCSGVSAAIQAAIGTINLLQGPTGPTGPTGPSVTGPTGPAGTAGTVSFSMANPGYILFGALGAAPMINFGFNATDSTGNATVSFAKPFTTTLSGVLGTVVAPEGVWVNPTSTNMGGFTAVTMTPYAPGSTFAGPFGFFWIAIGQ